MGHKPAGRLPKGWGPPMPPPRPPDVGGQTTQVRGVRAKGDVTVAPVQVNAPADDDPVWAHPGGTEDLMGGPERDRSAESRSVGDAVWRWRGHALIALSMVLVVVAVVAPDGPLSPVAVFMSVLVGAVLAVAGLVTVDRGAREPAGSVPSLGYGSMDELESVVGWWLATDHGRVSPSEVDVALWPRTLGTLLELDYGREQVAQVAGLARREPARSRSTGSGWVRETRPPVKDRPRPPGLPPKPLPPEHGPDPYGLQAQPGQGYGLLQILQANQQRDRALSDSMRALEVEAIADGFDVQAEADAYLERANAGLGQPTYSGAQLRLLTREMQARARHPRPWPNKKEAG